MLLDLTLFVTKEMQAKAGSNEVRANFGHLGTHFDVMDQTFPLEYTKRDGIVFDVSEACDHDIDLADIDFDAVKPGMFVGFYTGFMEREPYGTKPYYKEHPQLSNALIDALLEKQIAIIGIDFAGVRRGAEHPPTDQRCADQGVFVIENLVELDQVAGKPFTAHVYPVNFGGMTGLPCRVVAELH